MILVLCAFEGFFHKQPCPDYVINEFPGAISIFSGFTDTLLPRSLSCTSQQPFSASDSQAPRIPKLTLRDSVRNPVSRTHGLRHRRALVNSALCVVTPLAAGLTAPPTRPLRSAALEIAIAEMVTPYLSALSKVPDRRR